MKITIVGSGTVYLDDGKCQSCVVVEAADEILVLDLGPGATKGMMRLGVDRFSVDRVFFTHFHVDHTADIVPFLATMGFGPDEPRTKPLSIYGPAPFLDFWNSIPTVWMEGMKAQTYPLDVSEIPPKPVHPLKFPGYEVVWARAKHRPESVSYRISSSDSNGAFVYTGDTEYIESVVELARGADTLLIECSAADERPVPGHLTPSGVARIASEASVRRVLLTHVFPGTAERDLVSEVGRGFSGEVVVATDGMEFEV